MPGPSRFGDRRRLRIGLLGGSFNPAHAGHRHIAEALRRNLRLDQVWLLVSPGNPLKPSRHMAPLAARVASATRIADGRHIIATELEAQWGTLYTVDTVRQVRRRFPRMRFVWLMGADSLAELPRWRHWTRLIRQVPIAVHARPGSDRAALAGVAARRWHNYRQPSYASGALAGREPPAWAFLPLARHPASASALRAAGLGLNTAPVPDTTATASQMPHEE